MAASGSTPAFSSNDADGPKKKKRSSKKKKKEISSSRDVPSVGSFDSDFAEMMSKPLPDWFKKEKEKNAKFVEDLEANRERVKKEFQAKYDISEDQKVDELKKKWDVIEKNAARLEASGKNTNTRETKKQWQKFWDQEEEDTGFYLPGFFEVFPELKFLWPTWTRNQDGNVMLCETDEDCIFPQACCPHPILPGKKFCCTGTGQRILVPQYCPQELLSDEMLERARGADGSSSDERPELDEDDWRNWR